MTQFTTRRFLQFAGLAAAGLLLAACGKKEPPPPPPAPSGVSLPMTKSLGSSASLNVEAVSYTRKALTAQMRAAYAQRDALASAAPCRLEHHGSAVLLVEDLSHREALRDQRGRGGHRAGRRAFMVFGSAASTCIGGPMPWTRHRS